jgi:septal ring-binding cell division protein DamX
VTDARSRAYLESYLAEAGRAVEPGKLYVVPTGTADSPRYGVLFGSYDGKAEALAALGSLPAPLHQFKPYVRGLESVRDEARRAERR